MRGFAQLLVWAFAKKSQGGALRMVRVEMGARGGVGLGGLNQESQHDPNLYPL